MPRRHRNSKKSLLDWHLIVVELVYPTELGSVYDRDRDRYVGGGHGLLLCRRMGDPLEAPLFPVPMLFCGIKKWRKVCQKGATLRFSFRREGSSVQALMHL